MSDERPPLGHLSVFSSDVFPERERFSQFMEEMARKIVRIDGARLGSDPFRVELKIMPLGSAVGSTFEFSPGLYGRTKELVSDGNSDFILFLNLADCYSTSFEMRTGDVELIDNSQIGRLMAGRGGKVVTLTVPRTTLLALVPNAEDLIKRRIACPEPLKHLIRSYTLGLIEAKTLGVEAAGLAGNHLVDLMALALGADGDRRRLAEGRGLKAVRFEALCDHISRHISEASLSLSEVAKDSGISERQIQRLFEEAGSTFTDYVAEQRLLRAYRALTHSLLRHKRIVDIAVDCGFNDLSHFNRSFRRRFGMTPSEVRGG